MEGKEGIRKKEMGWTVKGGEGKGDRDGRENLGSQGRTEGKGVGKRGGEGQFRWPAPPPCFS